MINSFTGPNAFLHNWHRVALVWEGKQYYSAEIAFVAAHFPNELRYGFMEFKMTPWKARKMLAGASTYSLRPKFADIEEQVMLEIQRGKFDSSLLRQKLLNTGVKTLSFGNLHHDNHWGNCRCLTTDPAKLKYGTRTRCAKPGNDLLGKILMRVREEARAKFPAGPRLEHEVQLLRRCA